VKRKTKINQNKKQRAKNASFSKKEISAFKAVTTIKIFKLIPKKKKKILSRAYLTNSSILPPP